MNRSHREWAGFTIVELLVVIVVIAILAAITLVSYGNIQQRARNTQTISMVSSYERAIVAYVALNGKYPSFNGSSCLGVGYPDRDGDGVGDCGGTDYPAVENPDFNNAIRTILQSLPTVNATGLFTNPGVEYIGAYIVNWDEVTVNGKTQPFYIMYGLWGRDQNCGNSGVADLAGTWPQLKYPASQPYSWTDSGYTMCVIPLPNAT